MFRHGQITDADVYFEDKTLLGICSEFNIPDLENGQIEHETLGSIGVLKLPRRGLSAIEGSIKLKFPEPQLTAAMQRPNKAVTFQLHEKIDIFDSNGFDEINSTIRVTVVRALFSKYADDANKKGEAKAAEGEFSATYFMQRPILSQTPLIEIDLFANIHRINGKDVWPL